jgi:hypothetical protein
MQEFELEEKKALLWTKETYLIKYGLLNNTASSSDHAVQHDMITK